MYTLSKTCMSEGMLLHSVGNPTKRNSGVFQDGRHPKAARPLLSTFNYFSVLYMHMYTAYSRPLTVNYKTYELHHRNSR
jgi:hypothetical protein